MADVNANIDINIDSSNALAQLKSLQRQISQFHTSIAKSSEAAALAQRGLQKNLLNSINAIGAFTAEMRTVRTSAESFTDSLEKNKFSMREYFRYAGASTKTFGRLFKSEFDTIGKVAEERVKRLQTQYIKMGRDTNGAMRAIAVMPTELNMKDYTTQVQMAAQKQALFNQLMRQGSTNLLNFGKNTQWAGRQLMVGFTLPLMAVGSAATRTFMEMEAQALRFRKVYGDLFTPREETQQALANITELGRQFTRYGVAVSQTVGLAADAAAAGFQGLDLQRQTTEATRLSILGQVDSQKALETTISLQNAFKMSSQDLAGAIDFLNAVENQTVVSLDDITTAIPKVAPVIQQLGGNVKDLAFFIGALKEGGVNASEGANALKSGLGALINPTEKAAGMLADMGININDIVERNQGNLRATVIEFARALDTLDPLNRARAIEQLFGKFQFARLSTLFDNVTSQAGQAGRILELAGTSIEDLAALSQQELGMTADSAMNKFRKSVEDLKVALVPVGEAFLQAVTPIIDFVGNILDRFNNLSDGTKRVITLLTVGLGAVGPVLLMTFGLIANGVANLIKLFLTLRAGYQRLTGQSQVLGEQTQYLTSEQIDAAAAAHSLDQTHARLTQTFTAEASAINKLIQAYNSAAGAARNFAMNNPGMMMPPRGRKKFASGIVSVPGPKGAGDVVPAMLSPGEAVVPADMAEKYAPLINGMIADNIPGFKRGVRAGKFTAVDVPGGYDVAHFGMKSSMTGQQLVDMVAGLDTAAAKYIRNMVASVENGLQQSFTTFDNSVIAQFTTLNRELDKAGKASTQAVRENLVGAGFAEVRDVELQRQLTGAGMSIDEFKQVNQKITDQIVQGFDALGDQTTITAEQLDRLIRKAYEEVAKTDARIEQAYKNMQSITTVTDPRTSSRVPLTEQSYTISRKRGRFASGMESMAGAGRGPYTPVSRFGITGAMAGQIGLAHADAAKVYKQFSDEVKVKLASLRGDIAGFAKQFEIEAEKAGLKTGNAYKVGVDKSNAQDIYVETRDRTSPHRLADNDGRDDARAYSDARDKELNRRTRTRRVATAPQGAPPPIVPGGIPMSVLQAAYTENALRDKMRAQQEATAKMTQRMNTLNKAFMGGTFAISALSGVASMAGGNLGKFSEILFQISGPLFALSSIIQLLTGEKIVGLFQKLGALKIGLVAIGITALVTVVKLVSAAKEKERIATEGLANVINTTKDKLEVLGNFFNTIPTGRAGKNFVVSSAPIRAGSREQAQQLKANKDFVKQYEKDIKGLTDETEERALLSLQTLALDLAGQGFGKDAITTIITAITEEAGRSELMLKFKQIDVSTEEGKKAAIETARAITENFDKEFKKGVKKSRQVIYGGRGGAIVGPEVITLTKAQQKELKLGSQELGNTLAGVTGQFRAGALTGDQYSRAITEILGATYGVNNASMLLTSTLANISPETAKQTESITDYQAQLWLLRAALLEVAVSETLLARLRSTNMIERGLAIEELKKLIAAENKLKEEEAKNTNGGPKGQKEANALEKRIEQIRNQTKAFITLRNAKIDEATATELSNDAEIASLVVKNAKGKSLKQITKLVKDYKKALKDQTKAEFQYMSGPNLFKAQLERFKAQADLREKLIDIQFAPQLKAENDQLERQEALLQKVNDEIEAINRKQIEPLQARIEANNFALDKIALQEDAINEKYNKQIDALDKIATLNQDIANIQRQRMSIADALTRGDISAAAELMQDARAEQAQSEVARQKEGLTATRDAAIAALGRNKIEKENKILQLQITEIERGQLATLNSQKQTIEDTIQATNRNIDAINKQVEQQKLAALYGGKTKDEIAQLEGLIAAAEAAGIKFDAVLLSQAGNAQKLAAALAAALAAQKALGSGANTMAEIKAGYDAGTITAQTITPEQKAIVLQSIKDLNAKVQGTISKLKKVTGQKKMYGGLVKYMANGGAVGSDTVPAMLTPGEFIVNRAAASAYRPLLETINESKYPGMLGLGGTLQVPVNNVMTSMNDNSTAVYNYNLGFSINGSNGNPNDIARAVMREIKNVDAQRIRGQRV
jgi:TP901 family phage tail tape measure protein